MQPPTFEEFAHSRKPDSNGDHHLEDFNIEKCPTPGCECHEVHPFHEDAAIIDGFTCGNGCHFIAKRNAFTGEIICYQLTDYNSLLVFTNRDVIGLKFNPLGEPYTDWY